MLNVTWQLDKFGIKLNVEGTMLVWLVEGNEKHAGSWLCCNCCCIVTGNTGKEFIFCSISSIISCELDKKLSKSRSLMLTNGNDEDSFELKLRTVTGTGFGVLTTFNGGLFWLVVSLAQMPVALLKVSEIDLFLAEESFLAYVLIEASDLCPLILTMCLPGTFSSSNNWIEVTRTQWFVYLWLSLYLFERFDIMSPSAFAPSGELQYHTASFPVTWSFGLCHKAFSTGFNSDVYFLKVETGHSGWPGTAFKAPSPGVSKGLSQEEWFLSASSTAISTNSLPVASTPTANVDLVIVLKFSLPLRHSCRHKSNQTLSCSPSAVSMLKPL